MYTLFSFNMQGYSFYCYCYDAVSLYKIVYGLDWMSMHLTYSQIHCIKLTKCLLAIYVAMYMSITVHYDNQLLLLKL